ncbi:hypothetical protein [Peredibacter starrii]|uniref:Uncharacterized protein n=1 Tax=Peredibacter starrii TaxID=28202 RepID=A0AAX4HL27_9BACT|nr:hypothetical protein [Peredibacter starrii]WPU63973.1 hypothetical protein SOO65_14855 [Peredibacter starrii]
MSKHELNDEILFVGDDEDFFGQITSSPLVIKEDVAVLKTSYEKGSIFNRENIPRIVIVDVSNNSIDITRVTKEVLFYKKAPNFKSVFFALVCKNDEQKKELSFLFSTGFYLFHIKGGEIETFVRDVLYIGLKREIDFPRLACAKGINLPLQVGICSSLVKMEKDRISVEADLEDTEEELIIKFRQFPDNKGIVFPVKSSSAFTRYYPMLSTFYLDFPYPGPWEEIGPESILLDTVETWIENFASEFSEGDNFTVQVLSSDFEFLAGTFGGIEDRIKFIFTTSSESCPIEIMLEDKPDLIIANLSRPEEEGITPEVLDFLYSNDFVVSEYRPVIVIMNTPSKSGALQKLFNYERIVASHSPLDKDMFGKLLEKFKTKDSEGNKSSGLLKVNSPYRPVDILQEFYIVGLTEHEISFISQRELPFFAVLHFELPIEFHATIVPPIWTIDKKNDKNYYMALIHGLSEEKLMILRKFINQIIHSPLKEFTAEAVAEKLGEKALESAKAPSETIAVEANVVVKSAPTTKKEVRTLKISGKSKL